jgi:hypothetical protein
MTALYSGNLLDDRNGRPIEGAELYVYNSLGVEATLTDIANQPLTQPLITDADGAFEYKAADGVYRHDFWKNSLKIYTDNRIIVGVPAVVDVAVGAFGQTLVANATAVDAIADLGLSASGGSALMGFLQAGTGAVARTAQAKLREMNLTAKDFAATGNGSTNDTAFLQAWLDAHAAAQAAQSDQQSSPNIACYTAPVAELPPGVYVSDDLTYSGSSLRLRSTGGAMIKFNAGCGITATNVGTLDVYGITFVGGDTALKVTNNNLEGALYVVDRCKFHGQTDWPINFEPTTPNSSYLTNHLSGLAVIRDCLWYNTNGCARSYFDKTLIDNGYATLFRVASGGAAKWAVGRSAFESRSLGDGIELRGFFGTPIANNGSDDNVWVDNYPGFLGDQSAPSTPTAGYSGGTAVVSYGGGVYAHDCRFGAEEGGVPIIRNWCHGNGHPASLGNVHLIVENCGSMAAGNGGPASKVGVIVLKKGLPNSMVVKGGTGPVGAPYINATAMLDLTGSASNLLYWTDPARNSQNRYTVDIEGICGAPSGSLPPELGASSIVEGTTSGLFRQKIFGRLGLRGNMRLFNNQNAIVIDSESFGGAVRFRSNSAAGTDRGIQIGRVDNSGNFTGFWEVDADGGTLAVVTDAGNNIGSPSKRVATVYAVNVKLSPVAVGALPAAGTIGAGGRAFVNDANATTFASVVAGGGANGVPVYSDGTNWRIG